MYWAIIQDNTSLMTVQVHIDSTEFFAIKHHTREFTEADSVFVSCSLDTDLQLTSAQLITY